VLAALALPGACGLQWLPIEDPAQDYPHRFWLTADH
jgi:hypothetical protein